MNDEMFPSDNSQILGPGKLLRLAREEKNLRPEDVAYEIRLTPSQVLALDEDDYSKMPEETYVRGYLRNYARLVGVAENDILMAFARMTRSSEAAQAASLLQPENNNLAGKIDAGNGLNSRSNKRSNKGGKKGGGKILLIAIASIIFVGAVGAFVWLQEHPLESPEQAENILSTENEPKTAADFSSAIEEVPIGVSTVKLDAVKTEKSSNPLADSTDKLSDVAETPKLTTKTEVVETDQKSIETTSGGTLAIEADVSLKSEVVKSAVSSESDSITVISSENVEAEPATEDSAVGGGVLLLTYTKDSWTDVRDATGKKLLYRTVKTGEKVALAGKLPMSLFFGFAQGVDVKFNGKDIDVESYTRGVFARFSVGAAVSR